jgi:hypothetical protein
MARNPIKDIIPASQDERPVFDKDDVPLNAEPTRQEHKRRGAARATGATVTVRLTTRVRSKLLDGLTNAVVPFTEDTMSLEVRTDDLEALPPGLRRRAGTSDNGWTSLA